MSARLKLLGLVIFGIATVTIPATHPFGAPGWAGAVALLSLVLVVAALAMTVPVLGIRAPWHPIARLIGRFAIFGALLFAFQLWQNDWRTGVQTVGSLLALIVAAGLVTATTSATHMLDALTWALGGLRWAGVSPERVGLTMSLAIRTLPVTVTLARETRLAARARGIEGDPRALLIPFVLRSISHARATGDALHARGLDDA